MKLMKTLGLGIVVICAAMGSIGTSAATASSQVVGCLGTLEIKEGQMKCVGTYDLKSSVQINAGATGAKFSGLSLAETCGKSNLEMSLQTGNEAGTEGMLNTSELSFTGCEPCSKVEVIGLPYKNGTVIMATEAENNFIFASNAIGIALSGCPLSMTCKYAAKNAEFNYVVSKSFMTNELRVEGAPLEKIGGSEFCSSTSDWSSNYVTSIPEVWWLGLI